MVQDNSNPGEQLVADLGYLDLSQYITQLTSRRVKDCVRKNAKSVTVSRVHQLGHSLTWLVNLYLKKRDQPVQLFCKAFVPPQSESAVYQLRHDPHTLYFREKIAVQTLANSVTPASFGGLGGKLVPQLYGYDDHNLVLMLEYLSGPSNRDLFIGLANSDISGGKTSALYPALKQIARFDGLVNASLPLFNRLPRVTTATDIETLVDELLTIVRFNRNLEPSSQQLRSLNTEFH